MQHLNEVGKNGNIRWLLFDVVQSIKKYQTDIKSEEK